MRDPPKIRINVYRYRYCREFARLWDEGRVLSHMIDSDCQGCVTASVIERVERDEIHHEEVGESS